MCRHFTTLCSPCVGLCMTSAIAPIAIVDFVSLNQKTNLARGGYLPWRASKKKLAGLNTFRDFLFVVL